MGSSFSENDDTSKDIDDQTKSANDQVAMPNYQSDDYFVADGSFHRGRHLMTTKAPALRPIQVILPPHHPVMTSKEPTMMTKRACGSRQRNKSWSWRSRRRKTRGSSPTYCSNEAHHRRKQHGVEPEINWSALNVAQINEDPIVYSVSFPGVLNSCQCPVEDCPYSARTRGGLRSHFQRRHWRHSIHIQEEHPLPYPKCQRCDLQVPFAGLNNSHYNSDLCRDGTARKRQREAELLSYRANNVFFDIEGSPLERVGSFKYLGRIVADNNSDWPALYHNLKKARSRWAMVSRVLEKDGSSKRCRGLFYKAVVQSILLYGCESWTITDAMMKVLEGFHHRVARRITGNQARHLPSGEWEYPPLQPALEQAGLFPLREYVRRRQAQIEDYIATRPIFDLCREAEELSGSNRTLRWWQQDHTVENDDNDDNENENVDGIDDDNEDDDA